MNAVATDGLPIEYNEKKYARAWVVGKRCARKNTLLLETHNVKICA